MISQMKAINPHFDFIFPRPTGRTEIEHLTGDCFEFYVIKRQQAPTLIAFHNILRNCGFV